MIYFTPHGPYYSTAPINPARGYPDDVADWVDASDLSALRAEITHRVQQRLDDFAQTRGYGGILSLCTYATSTQLRFATEGQYGVEARDATWSKLYDILAEVEAGTRQPPGDYEILEPELPALAWPGT
jgi:hypothetical protein